MIDGIELIDGMIDEVQAASIGRVLLAQIGVKTEWIDSVKFHVDGIRIKANGREYTLWCYERE